MNKLILLFLVVLSFSSCITWKTVEPEAIALAKTIYADVCPVADDLQLSKKAIGLYNGTVHMLKYYFFLDYPILTFIHEQTHHYQYKVLHHYDNSTNYDPDFPALITGKQLETEQEANLVASFIGLTKYGMSECFGYGTSDIPYMVKYMVKWMGFTFSK